MTICNMSVRSYAAENIAITISPITTTTFNFITEPGTAVTHATIIIPSGTLLPPVVNGTSTGSAGSLSSTQILEITPVADSQLQGLINTIDSTRTDYVGTVFPLSDAKLSFYQTVRSSVFRINATGRADNVPYRFPIYLTIDYEPVSTDLTDYCIGQANFTISQWVCLRLNSVSNSTGSATFNLTSDGVYAVIFNPERRDAALIAAIPTWWDQHKGQFFLWGGVSLLAVALFAYVFWRMMRYVAKYRGSKKVIDNINKQINELQQQSTDILGQSLRDKVEGIVFVVNPMHEKHEKPDLSADIKEMEKALTKLDERDKQLEGENENLLNRNKVLEKELSKLKEQFSQ
jgi:cell division protein FtsB